MAEETSPPEGAAPEAPPPVPLPLPHQAASVPPDVTVPPPPAPPAAVPTPEADGTPPAAEHEPAAAPAAGEAPAAEEPAKPDNKHWYVVKVQSGREESIKDAIERRVKIEGLEEFFGQILIPVEKVTEMRRGKRYVKSRKLYPGYLMVNVEYNESILYLFRETSGVGDFVGGSLNKPPLPMKPNEIAKMLGGPAEPAEDPSKIKAQFDRGDRVKVRDGTFAGMEGEVKELLEAKAAVRVELTIFGRPVPVELEYWQVEPV